MHSSVLLFLNIGSSEMVLIVFVALLLFGGEKLPEIARGLGKGIRDFKDASEGVKREINNQINSYEEKREEKKMDEIAAAAQQTALNPAPESSEALLEAHQPVSGTMQFIENPNPVINERAVETHAEEAPATTHDISHIDLTKTESTKNS
ncbi:Sec-independent protein translocase subunit TatA/TatB [Mucilaginibacter sp.]|uniref:Sec-independent protein translocase subunit TatA/TatB n=1 Tax=Mucilaginibacter sp. TaxID=1882438 RepID=UPI003D1233C9